MKIFLDTANLEEIRQGVSLGVVDGVTTNPTLVAREHKPFREHILDICEIVKEGVVNAEVVSTDTAGILREAREVASWHPNIVVKLPMIPDGVRALTVLAKEGIRVNVTLVFSAAQALLVAKAGAYFVSPFLGRLDDVGQVFGATPFRCFREVTLPNIWPAMLGAFRDRPETRAEFMELIKPRGSVL